MAKAEVVSFRIPQGDVVTIRLVDRGSRGVNFEPVSNNARHRVHHHAYKDRNGKWNILIRDNKNQNVAAFVLNKSKGYWDKRPLTAEEKRRR